MEKALDSILGPQTQAVELRAQRAKILATNIANSDTPRYLARDVDFQAALDSARSTTQLSTTDANHLSNASAAHKGLSYRIPEQPAADGNTVDIHGEKARFTENSVGYLIDLSFLDARVKKLIRLFRGE